MSLSLATIVMAMVIVFVGTAVQASLGFGLAMVAAPLLYLIDPVLVPGPMVMITLSLAAWMSWTERHAIDFTHFGPALAGRLVGSPLAAVLLGLVSAQTFDLLFGTLVLLAVAMSLMHPHLVPRAGTVFAGTLASSVMGTLSGIDGPPIALVYQNSRGAALRANLAMLSLMGAVISLVSLAMVGRFGWPELQMAAPLLLGVIPGCWCAGFLRRHLDGRNMRPYLLGLCVLSVVVVLGRAALTYAQA